MATVDEDVFVQADSKSGCVNFVDNELGRAKRIYSRPVPGRSRGVDQYVIKTSCAARNVLTSENEQFMGI